MPHDDDGPGTMAEATASGLALACLGTLIDRYESDREGAPIERFDDRWDLVETAIHKGIVYMGEDNRLYRTDSDRLAAAENYQDARAAARLTAEERGHEVVEP